MHKDQQTQDYLRIDKEVYPKCEGKILATKHSFRCAFSINMDFKGAGVGQLNGFKCIRRGPFVDSYKHQRNNGSPLNLRVFLSSRASVRFWRKEYAPCRHLTQCFLRVPVPLTYKTLRFAYTECVFGMILKMYNDCFPKQH
jgi:hypothetical protein